MMKVLLIFTIFAALRDNGCLGADEWSYEGSTGPAFWKNSYPSCGGLRQSPIQIPSCTVYNPGLDNLVFGNYDKPIKGKIENNGHTVDIDIERPELYLQNGGLNGKYIAAGIHFHWGRHRGEGSEHTFLSGPAPLEMHIVHYKQEYGNVSESLNHADGLAVVAVVFAVSHYDNVNMNKLIDKLPGLVNKGSSAPLSGLALTDFVDDSLQSSVRACGCRPQFHRYQGSLTTPPCSEAVTWTIMKHESPIGPSQLQKFWNIRSSSATEPPRLINYNARPIQPLGDRTVYRSFDGSASCYRRGGKESYSDSEESYSRSSSSD